jgi:hypothetical protein
MYSDETDLEFPDLGQKRGILGNPDSSGESNIGIFDSSTAKARPRPVEIDQRE